MSSPMNDLLELANIHQAKLGNGGFFTSVPDVGAPTAGDGVAEFARRPWLDPPEGSYAFDEEDGIMLPAAPSGFVQVLGFYVPDGSDGVINYISNNFLGGGFVGFSGDIIWQILSNGKPVRNFSNIRAEKGTVNQGRKISPIRIFSNEHIQYMVNHVANIALNGQVVCSLNGNYYPSQK